MNKLYAFRGYILGALALLLLAIPGVGFPSKPSLWVPFILAETLFLLSVLLRIQTRRYIGDHTRGSIHDADKLVTVGVYSRIRHPLYLSNMGVGTSFALFHLGFSWETLLFVMVLVGYEVLLSRLEDSFLENRFQESWRAWKSVTPAFIPRKNRVAYQEPERSFVQSIKSDVSTWIWLAIFIVLLFLRKAL